MKKEHYYSALILGGIGAVYLAVSLLKIPYDVAKFEADRQRKSEGSISTNNLRDVESSLVLRAVGVR